MPKVKIICANPKCGIWFWDYPSKKRIYCSMKCRSSVNSKGIDMGCARSKKKKVIHIPILCLCDVCNSPVLKSPRQVQMATFHLCSEECRRRALRLGLWKKPHGNTILGRRVEHVQCYLKEARAIITGMHWEGHNRCVPLVGD